MDFDHVISSCDTIRIVAATDRRDWTRRVMHPLETQIRSAAGTHVPVLISADKARAKAIAMQIHRRSRYADRELVIVDCSLPADAYDERLWQTTPGSASLFLMEVSHLPLRLQLSLRARLITESRARSRTPADALTRGRLLASSSTNLFEVVEEGWFDRDLFYRLNTFHIIP